MTTRTKTVEKKANIYRVKTDLTVIKPVMSGIITNIINDKHIVKSDVYATIFEFKVKEADFAVRMKVGKNYPFVEVLGVIAGITIHFKRNGQRYEIVSGENAEIIELFKAMNKVLAVKKYEVEIGE